MRNRCDPRWAAGRGKRVGGVGGGWASLDWALPGTGSAVSAPPPAGQGRAGSGRPGGSRVSERSGGSGNPPFRESGESGDTSFLLTPPVVITPRVCIAFPGVSSLDPPESLKR